MSEQKSLAMVEDNKALKVGRIRAPGAGRKCKLKADETTLKTISKLSMMQCTYEEACDWFDVSRQTFRLFLARNIKAKMAWKSGAGKGRVSVRRAQFNMAMKSATMSIWWGKQYLGQKDKQEIGGIPGGAPVSLEHGAERGLTALLLAARDANRRNAEGEGEE